MQRLTRFGLIVVFAASALAPTATSAAKKGKTDRVVALVFTAKGKPNSKLYAAVYNELTRAAKKAKKVKLLQGAALKKAMKKKPEPLFAKCGADIACTAKLGRTAGAERVIAVRVSPAGADVQVQMVIIDVAGQALLAKVEAEVTSVAKAGQLVAAHETELFGSAPAAAEELPLDLILDTPPPAVADATDPEPASGPAADELPLELALAEPPASDAGAASAPPELGPEPGPPPAEELTAVALPAVVAPPPSTERSRLWTYVGVGVAGLGAAALGAGGYFGLQATSIRDSVQRGADGDTQQQGKRKQDDANASAGRANLMFGIGGGLLAAGGALVALDLWVFGPSAPTPRLSLGGDGAALELGWRF